MYNRPCSSLSRARWHSNCSTPVPEYNTYIVSMSSMLVFFLLQDATKVHQHYCIVMSFIKRDKLLRANTKMKVFFRDVIALLFHEERASGFFICM